MLVGSINNYYYILPKYFILPNIIYISPPSLILKRHGNKRLPSRGVTVKTEISINILIVFVLI